MNTIIFLFATYHLSASTKRLLQQQSEQTLGAYEQICIAPESDFACQYAHQSITDQGSGVVECSPEYSCCLCESITCGSVAKPCDEFKAGADFAAFGVKKINVFGEANEKGAIIDCNGEGACAETIIRGSWIDTVRCGADGSCSGALMQLSESRGIVCGKGACIGATIVFNSNRGGELMCSAEHACANAVIQISGIFDVKCNGERSCENTQITVKNPFEQFKLDCNGDLACHNLDLTILFPGPDGGCPAGMVDEPFMWKGINCGSTGACKEMKLTVVNNGCRTVIIEDLQCSPGGACTGAVFDLNSGTGFGVEVKNCMCGPSCQEAVGLDACYNNVQLLECPDPNSCAAQSLTISNPANDFVLLCSNTRSCAELNLEIILSGASLNLVQRFGAFICSANMACQDAVINIKNPQITSHGVPVLLSVQEIQCIAPKACDGATFITNSNVNIEQVVCVGNSCDNCVVKESETSVGIPCAQYTVKTLPDIPNGPVIQIPADPIVIPHFNPIEASTSTSTTSTTSTSTTSTTSTTTTSTTETPVVVAPIVPVVVDPIVPYIPATPSNVHVGDRPVGPVEIPPI